MLERQVEFVLLDASSWTKGETFSAILQVIDLSTLCVQTAVQ